MSQTKASGFRKPILDVQPAKISKLTGEPFLTETTLGLTEEHLAAERKRFTGNRHKAMNGHKHKVNARNGWAKRFFLMGTLSRYKAFSATVKKAKAATA